MNAGDGEEFAPCLTGGGGAYTQGDGFTEPRILVRNYEGFNRWTLTLPAARALQVELERRRSALRTAETEAMRARPPRVEEYRECDREAMALGSILAHLEGSIDIFERAERAREQDRFLARQRLAQFVRDGSLFSLTPLDDDAPGMWHRIRARLPRDR